MKHISIREYAQRNCISYGTVYRMIKDGRLPQAAKVSREVWRIPVDDTVVTEVKGK